MTAFSGITVFDSVSEDKLMSGTIELLACARKLADGFNEKVNCILFGEGLNKTLKEAVAFGADNVFVADDPLLKKYNPDVYSITLDRIVRQTAPRCIILGQTSTGADIAPRLAFKLGCDLVTDCVEINVNKETDSIIPIHPIYGGKIHAAFSPLGSQLVLTLRQKSIEPLERDDSRKGEIIPVKVNIDPALIRIKVVKKIKEETEGIRLENAPVVVSGGRGIGSKENFKHLKELAGILNGAVGGSRPATDNGWVPATSKVGLTGKIVAPNVYIAIGISGSSQHLAGCIGSKNIVAINNDPAANIFRVSRYGVVGDWEEILPGFTEKLRELNAL
ncbi:MAG: electron transfer flavoprotein subunit alpha/FixB family protein [Proteobacteria bacterium]|nr:electron transfer flavoprotein subunit alpha/FixB family protein [Pseudomonadota bacterium]MBU4009851.1 electron transfer flavoprotein subunit alpha/FixB family protein [Pseudomonadota bacterium]MBU4034823.1 electron transfer flavoprotein subunit alpha/FixB family protein [Pseudomonadota bacterium]